MQQTCLLLDKLDKLVYIIYIYIIYNQPWPDYSKIFQNLRLLKSSFTKFQTFDPKVKSGNIGILIITVFNGRLLHLETLRMAGTHGSLRKVRVLLLVIVFTEVVCTCIIILMNFNKEELYITFAQH